MPALLNGAVLALLDTSIALDMMLSATLIAIMPDGEVLSSPSPSQLDKSASIHAFAFTSDGELVLVESEGSFDMDQWEEAAEKAQHICLHKPIGENPERMEDSEMNGEGLVETMKNAIGAKVALDRKWRQGVK